MPKSQQSTQDNSAFEAPGVQPENDRIRYAIRKLRGKDRVGTTGEYLGVAGGAAAGAAAAGAVASAAGVTSIWGATTVVGALGGVFVAATPIGWVIGTAAVGGLAGFGIAKLVRSGSRQDARRAEQVKSLEERLRADVNTTPESSATAAQLQHEVKKAVGMGLVSAETAARMLNLVERNALSVDVALDRVRRVCDAKA
jgi:hypothetical protein